LQQKKFVTCAETKRRPRTVKQLLGIAEKKKVEPTPS